MADHPLQEVEFPIAGKTWRARPVYSVLARVEYMMGAPCRELGARAYASALPMAQRNGVKELGIAETVNVLCAIFSGVPNFPGPEALGDTFLDEGGYLDLMSPLGDFLVRAIRGNKEYEKDVRERAAEAERKAKDGGQAEGDAEANPPDQKG